ncbi:putative sporulation protein YtxC [Bacillus sp. FJAT-47783]|uniref:putative sporulation protein YtxC n=1 Tax=Bacillus sp. FJAT-47783 TaxID=2922712 RepID=UPI001FADC915
MIQIVLSTKKEAEYILHLLLEAEKNEHDTVWQERDTIITCTSDRWEDFLQDVLIPTLLTFLTKIKEPQLLLSIMKEKFYYTDEDEQQQILHIAQSIMEGERDEIPKVKDFEPREQFLYTSFLRFLRPELTFFMDSFIRFRLHHYLKRLTEYVEISIEEYKLEQEYQNFIQGLREYVIKHEPKVKGVHLLHQDNSSFLIYNDTWKELTPNELKSFIDRHFIYQHPMYIDSKLLAPLVSMAPKTLSIYSDEQDEGMIVTIQNIFQERVSIYSRDAFHQRKASF